MTLTLAQFTMAQFLRFFRSLESSILPAGVIFPLFWFAPVHAQTIHEAIQAGSLERVVEILDRDPESLTVRNEFGRDPIHEACFRGHLPILELLVSRGADVTARARSENTTLHLALHGVKGPKERGEVTAFLLAHSPGLATTRNINGITPLHWAGNELPETIELLIASGADLDARDKNGLTPLHHWIRWWEGDRSELLVQHGADLEARDVFGRTPLHLAAIVGRLDKYRMLRDAGAALSPKDDAGMTPADYALKFGHPALADSLLEAGTSQSPSIYGYDTDSLLVAGVDPGQVAIWYLDSNGWAIRTSNHVLVFDYAEGGLSPSTPGLANGRIRGRELSDLPVTVFATSEEVWDPGLLDLRDEIRDVHFVLGFNSNDTVKVTPMVTEATVALGGLEVRTARSGHGGTAFYVRVDGLTLVHLGLPRRFSAGGSRAWQASLSRLREEVGEIDLAFIPLLFGGDDEAEAVEEFLSVTSWLVPRVVFSSAGNGTHRYLLRAASEKARQRWAGVRAEAAENRGDLFLLRPSANGGPLGED